MNFGTLNIENRTSNAEGCGHGDYWRTALPIEVVRKTRGRMEESQAFRCLSVPVRRPEMLAETRAAFSQFADSELVLMVHPQNRWAAIARKNPGPPPIKAPWKRKTAREVKLSRNIAPFVGRANRRYLRNEKAERPADKN